MLGRLFNVSAKDNEKQKAKREEEERTKRIAAITEEKTRRGLNALMNERELAADKIRENAEVRIANETVERIETQKLKQGMTRLTSAKENAIQSQVQKQVTRETDGQLSAVNNDRNATIDSQIDAHEVKKKREQEQRNSFERKSTPAEKRDDVREEKERERGSWSRDSEASRKNEPRKRGDWGTPNRGDDSGRKPS